MVEMERSYSSWPDFYSGKKPSTPASKLKPKTCFPGVTPTFSGGITQVLMWKLDHKEGWVLKNWYFWTETIESLLDSKEIKPVNPEGNQPWIFIGIADAVDEAPRLWLPDDTAPGRLSFTPHHGTFVVVVQLSSCVWLFATSWTTACQSSLPFTISWSLPKFMSIASVMPSSHLILWCPLLLPSIFPSIRNFSSELVVHIRWPKY